MMGLVQLDIGVKMLVILVTNLLIQQRKVEGDPVVIPFAKINHIELVFTLRRRLPPPGVASDWDSECYMTLLAKICD